ncbi:centromere kinetochore component CENP-T-domain-containing protein [Tricladium varicosporioides]|nr:centromere kinetochore component CENP-T-domain-containing protein [Hymenoscyphus varicosporioides]
MSIPDGHSLVKNVNNRLMQPIRATTQDSDLEDSVASIKEQTYIGLPAFASIPRPTTPLRRASSAGPPSTYRSSRRTPAVRTPGAGQRSGSGRKPIAVTPHGRAAQRQLEARRAGLTPGKDRRRSGLQQRETPRDTLRALSRLLAPKSTAIVPTPEASKLSTGKYNLSSKDDEDDDGLGLERPRLSLPIGDEDYDDDEDDSSLLPPRSAGLEDENFTVQSVEFARRAVSEQPYSRLSRESFGSIRMGDHFADLSDLGPDGVPEDSSFMGGIAFGDNVEELDDGEEISGENTETLRNIGFDSGRISDIRPVNIPADDTENTFVFTVPHRDASELQSEGGSIQQGLTEEEGVINQYKDDGELMNQDDEDASNEDNVEMGESELPGSTLNTTNYDMSMLDATGEVELVSSMKSKATKKHIKVSKHGIQYRSLPSGVVKKLATTYARIAGNSKAKLNKETLDAIIQASDWFFEQISDDLGAYAKHAGRKTIEESDVVTLMARQRQTNASTTPFSLAQKNLPRELLQELRMVPPSKLKKGRPLQQIDEDD